MQLLKRWGLRLWDAGIAFCAVLFGSLELRSMKPTSRVRQSAEHAKALLEVTSVLEMMHAMISRMGARESRAAKKLLDEVVGESTTGGESYSTALPLDTRERKKALQAYVTAQRYGTGGTPPPSAPAPVAQPVENPNGDDQLELDEGEP